MSSNSFFAGQARNLLVRFDQHRGQVKPVPDQQKRGGINEQSKKPKRQNGTFKNKKMEVLMSMTRKQKDELVVVIEGFLTASAMPEREQLLAQLGLNAALLEEGRNLVELWHIRRQDSDDAERQWHTAVENRQNLFRVSQLEMAGLTNTIRRRFYNNKSVLRQLGLGTRRKTVTVDTAGASNETQSETPEEAGQEKVTRAVRRTRTEGVMIMGWRDILNNIPLLPEEVRQTLTLFGFDETRLDAMRQGVEAFAASLPLRDLAQSDRKERTRLFKLTERELLNWVTTLRGMIGPRARQLRESGNERLLTLMAV